MSGAQFTALIRLPFTRGNFEDPPQAQWDAEKDRQLWKIISKSSKTSDLNWVELATKFQVPPAFLLQQAAWLYERHLNHVRNQMKKVSGSNVPTSSTGGGSTFTPTGGVPMQRTRSGGPGTPRTASAFTSKPKDNPSMRGGETVDNAPVLSRTPSTNTITQSRANTQQPPVRTSSTRSQRPSLSSPRTEERRHSSITAQLPSPVQDDVDPPGSPDSISSSSSSFSDTDHPAHRSQLFKRPPRFKSQRPQGLPMFEEGDAAQEGDTFGSHGSPSLPFASAVRPQPSNRYVQNTLSKTNRPGPKGLSGPSIITLSSRQKSVDQQSQAVTETVSSMTSSASASASEIPIPTSAISPLSQASNHRAELARLGSPRQRAPRSRREGSEGTPSMGSSFSDIDDAGISQSALEEALLSNMQHGRMSTLSRMSRYL